MAPRLARHLRRAVHGTFRIRRPFPSPEAFGEYNDYDRRGSRLIHAYVIVCGVTSVHLQRDLPPGTHPGPRLPLAFGAHATRAAGPFGLGPRGGVATFAAALGLAAWLPDLLARRDTPSHGDHGR